MLNVYTNQTVRPDSKAMNDAMLQQKYRPVVAELVDLVKIHLKNQLDCTLVNTDINVYHEKCYATYNLLFKLDNNEHLIVKLYDEGNQCNINMAIKSDSIVSHRLVRDNKKTTVTGMLNRYNKILKAFNWINYDLNEEK